MPYNTWRVTRENPTAVYVKFTDRAPERQQAEQFSSRRADKAIANQEGTFLV